MKYRLLLQTIDSNPTFIMRQGKCILKLEGNARVDDAQVSIENANDQIKTPIWNMVS